LEEKVVYVSRSNITRFNVRQIFQEVRVSGIIFTITQDLKKSWKKRSNTIYWCQKFVSFVLFYNWKKYYLDSKKFCGYSGRYCSGFTSPECRVSKNNSIWLVILTRFRFFPETKRKGKPWNCAWPRDHFVSRSCSCSWSQKDKWKSTLNLL